MTAHSFPSRARGLVLVCALLSLPAAAGTLRVMTMGLGEGSVTGPGISCTSTGGDCDETYAPGTPVTLTATWTPATATFVGWNTDPDADPLSTPDCTGMSSTCSFTVGTATRSVRPVFNRVPDVAPLTALIDDNNYSVDDLRNYLTANPVYTAAEFLRALPAQYKDSPILMTRSESLQTGTAEFPRLILVSHTGMSVFSIALAPPASSGSYPGSHPDVIEYMQFDTATNNFRFHEIVLPMAGVSPMGDPVGTFPFRSRGVAEDDTKCSSCHSTRNVLNRTGQPGTTGGPVINSVPFFNKPNWDPYDSWGGMLPFNRDKLFQGSVETAAYRRLFNPWTWRTNRAVRTVIEQLRFQPSGVSSADTITRFRGGDGDGVPRFPFDGTAAPVLNELAPTGTTGSALVAYSFDRHPAAGTADTVPQGGSKVTLFHNSGLSGDEGRGVQLFDLLSGFEGNLNPRRVAAEVASHRWAPGNRYLDPRPIALAIAKGSCLTINSVTHRVQSTSGTLSIDQAFFEQRAGMNVEQLITETRELVGLGTTAEHVRERSIPRRKADIERLNLDRAADPYVRSSTSIQGLIQRYGMFTSEGTSTSLTRLRRDVFRRSPIGFTTDTTVIGGKYVDREVYSNADTVGLFRFFLEPLGISVDKWSMGVRGRSRTFAFADTFDHPANGYPVALRAAIEADLAADPIPGLAAPYSCAALTTAINTTLGTLPSVTETPRYSDVQRIFNKSCIECHGGLNYPPYRNAGTSLRLQEDQIGAVDPDPLKAPHDLAAGIAEYLYTRITTGQENCPSDMTSVARMPCGGPPLTETDLRTIRRWIDGGTPISWGDPHLTTIDGVHYDFQGAGEYVLMREPGLELQARDTPVQSNLTVYNDYTGLDACPSITTAFAAQIGGHRVTYQMNGEQPESLELRLDGKQVPYGAEYVLGGARITALPSPNGLQLEGPGGTRIQITVEWWAYAQVWFMSVNVVRGRGTEGLLGSIAPTSWLPDLSDGTQLAARPADPHDRYVDLYERFGDSWRVTPATALFDYAPGFSTEMYTVKEWPGEKGAACLIKDPPPGIRVVPPPEPLPVEVAEKYCANVVNEIARRDCVSDVSALGDPVFAAGYQEFERVERNQSPEPPALETPRDFEPTGEQVTFQWSKSFDKDDDPVAYRLCLWSSDTAFTFEACDAKPTTDLAATRVLKSGGYFWKVLAEDGQGASTESQTRRVDVK